MRLLCVCTGNTCRSPMLQAFLRQRLREAGRTDVTVASAGLAASDGAPISSESATAVAERGIDISGHQARSVRQEDLDAADRIYCLTENHAFALHQHGVPGQKLFVVNAEHGGVPDPIGRGQSVYDAVAKTLEDASVAIVDSLPSPGTNAAND